ncbi:MAG: prepilin-type N-terminal cleavage/methylation domain-containing protein [Candidatus Saccharimonadales bacterium]
MQTKQHNYENKKDAGFTLVELVIALGVFSVVAASIFGLFISLTSSAVIAKQKAIAITIVTNEMERLKSLPYDSLAVAGGSIYSANPLPATTTTKVNGFTYTAKISVSYVDDAFDGCADYPSPELKAIYCRNYPPPTGAPAVDNNPQDYKIIRVAVYNKNNAKLADLDTQVSARVSETSSSTGALFVSIIDDTGNPVNDATVTVVNNSVAPNVNASDTTDSNGIAIFYGFPPDSGYDYVVTANAPGYSTISTIAPFGGQQPNYPSQKIFTQKSSYVTLPIKPQGSDSILVEATDVSGSPINGLKIYAKGGYKKYVSSSDTSYYYDNMSPSDSRPTSNVSGLASLSNLVPGEYIFCGDDGSTNCKVGGTTYYLAAAVPYTGNNSLSPIIVPTYTSSSPPSITFPFNSGSYLQKVRLMLTTNSNFPRISTMNPYELSLSSGTVNNFGFQINGNNLPCSTSSCLTSVKITQSGSVFNAVCSGTSAGLQLNCTANLSGIAQGTANLTIQVSGYVLALPSTPQMGGLNVTP